LESSLCCAFSSFFTVENDGDLRYTISEAF
jgi:hypothetical protein